MKKLVVGLVAAVAVLFAATSVKACPVVSAAFVPAFSYSFATPFVTTLAVAPVYVQPAVVAAPVVATPAVAAPAAVVATPAVVPAVAVTPFVNYGFAGAVVVRHRFVHNAVVVATPAVVVERNVVVRNRVVRGRAVRGKVVSKTVTRTRVR